MSANTGNNKRGVNQGQTRLGKGHVTKDEEYKKGLVGTTKYVVDKKPKVNPHISPPSDAKEDGEPGKPLH